MSYQSLLFLFQTGGIHMTIATGSYISGFEAYGPNNRIIQTKGWVNNVRTDGEHLYYDVRADDSFNGARGTTLSTEYGGIVKLDRYTEEPIEKRTGFTITCNQCGAQNDYHIHGRSGYGVTITCACGCKDEDGDDNSEDIFW